MLAASLISYRPYVVRHPPHVCMARAGIGASMHIFVAPVSGHARVGNASSAAASNVFFISYVTSNAAEPAACIAAILPGSKTRMVFVAK